MSEAFCDYISQADEAHRADLIAVYQVMKAVLPDEEERINWGMPTFGNNIIHFAAAKHHVGIYPGPEAVEHFTPALDERRLKHSKGAIQMPYGRVDLPLVTQIAEYCRDHG